MDGPDTVGERLWQAFDMFELGVEIMAAGLRRRYPHDSPEEIERRLEAWLADRPCDADGADVTLQHVPQP